LQLLVIVGLVVVIAKPSLVPEPFQGIAKMTHSIIMGPEDTWISFRDTWQKRLNFLGTKMPESPPQITADNVLELLNKITITGPMTKWQKIKPDLTLAPIEIETTSSASPSATE